MFEAEARWIGDRLAAFPTEQLSPLLNIGSSTGAFREIGAALDGPPYFRDRWPSAASTSSISMRAAAPASISAPTC